MAKLYISQKHEGYGLIIKQFTLKMEFTDEIDYWFIKFPEYYPKKTLRHLRQYLNEKIQGYNKKIKLKQFERYNLEKCKLILKETKSLSGDTLFDCY